ncbi:LOW QUALITY PROTEIN: rho guanine nucleotide exchange factor 26-like [Rhynchonycteris naso]
MEEHMVVPWGPRVPSRLMRVALSETPPQGTSFVSAWPDRVFAQQPPPQRHRPGSGHRIKECACAPGSAPVCRPVAKFCCISNSPILSELEARHENNIFIDDISDIVEKHTASTFDPYVKYCKVYQQRTLQKLLATNPYFKEVLSRIKSHEDCRNLPMISLLILPMQRVTRLPLLMDFIFFFFFFIADCQKTPKDSLKYEACKRALKEVSKLVRLYNEGAQKMERTEMMYTINSQLKFKIKLQGVNCRCFACQRQQQRRYNNFEQGNNLVENHCPRVMANCQLLHQSLEGVKMIRLDTGGNIYLMTSDMPREESSGSGGLNCVTRDMLGEERTLWEQGPTPVFMVASEESYNINDYSLRDQLLVESLDNEELNSSPGKNSSMILYSRQNSASHLFTLTVLSNHANEKVDMLLGAKTESECARWITALGHSSRKQPPDTSLTQVEIIRSFTTKQPDELSLQVADVVLIYQRVSDGEWYEGERLRDGERGWFPMECAKEITCQATIDKNVERMGRLLGLQTNV